MSRKAKKVKARPDDYWYTSEGVVVSLRSCEGHYIPLCPKCNGHLPLSDEPKRRCGLCRLDVHVPTFSGESAA
jgi:hypothetical protein